MKRTQKFCDITTLDLSYVVTVKSTVEISQNFVAFSEYMNFTKQDDKKYFLKINDLHLVIRSKNSNSETISPHFAVLSQRTSQE